MHPDIQAALDDRRFFKLICGASYRNPEFVTLLSHIFASAGVHVIDIGTRPELVDAVKSGIASAQMAREQLPLIMVSVGINHDVHFLRVEKTDALCDDNGFCANACPHEVFVGKEIRLENCLGCDHCIRACPTDALTLVPREPLAQMRQQLEACLERGANALEIHTGNGERAELKAVLEEIRPFRERFELLAFSVGSHGQSYEAILSLVQDIHDWAGSDMIIQADGQPISGRKGSKSTLPCLELAEFLFQQGVPGYIQVSGGTNNLTGRLAKEKNIPIHGIGMGSFARKYLNLKPSQDTDSAQLDQAITRARELILSV